MELESYDLVKYKKKIYSFCTFAKHGGGMERGLLLNAAKTQELIIDFRKSLLEQNLLTHPVEIDGQTIQRDASISCLGIQIQENVKWDQ